MPELKPHLIREAFDNKIPAIDATEYCYKYGRKTNQEN